ncbi:MAG: hypothetical protein U9N04_04420 [Patescibacteria group bacterium]|nr:hypothetical protein [Patescibacteria group bacterium]
MLEVLEKLFRSKAEIKLLRLFLNNPDKGYALSEIISKLKITSSLARKEINNLVKIEFLALRKKAKQNYYYANRDFVFYDELRKLIFKTNPTSSDKITSQVMKLGQIRFVLISGVLINSEKGRIDIVIIGEHISKTKLKNFLANIEAEVGKNINYSCMSVDEFRYRKSMFDKFIIDVFEDPHKILINKLKNV